MSFIAAGIAGAKAAAPIVAKAAPAVLGFLGQRGQAQASAAQAQQNRALDMQMFEARRKAHQELVARGRTDMAAGTEGFMNEANQQLPELQAMQNDLATGNATALNQGAAQMQANMATAGVRGGQAATQMNRGMAQQAVGAQRGINEMAFNEAAQRAAERRGFHANKASMGQGASYTPANF